MDLFSDFWRMRVDEFQLRAMYVLMLKNLADARYNVEGFHRMEPGCKNECYWTGRLEAFKIAAGKLEMIFATKN